MYAKVASHKDMKESEGNSMNFFQVKPYFFLAGEVRTLTLGEKKSLLLLLLCLLQQHAGRHSGEVRTGRLRHFMWSQETTTLEIRLRLEKMCELRFTPLCPSQLVRTALIQTCFLLQPGFWNTPSPGFYSLSGNITTHVSGTGCPSMFKLFCSQFHPVVSTLCALLLLLGYCPFL